MPDKTTPSGLRSFDDFYARLQTARSADYQDRPSARARSRAAFEALKGDLLELYDGVTACSSFRDAGGQIFDCVTMESQPALRGRKAAAPPDVSEGEEDPLSLEPRPLRESRRDDHGNRMWCPPGCVPIRRLSLDELMRVEDPPRPGRKDPGHGRCSPADGEAAVSPGAPRLGHRYAHASQEAPNKGASAHLNVWAPSMEVGTFSASQIWVSAPSDRGLQTVEAGWHVYPGKYKHALPVLFTYWTADGYRNTGAYNYQGFVHYGASRPLGMAIDSVSTADGPQRELRVILKLADGAWWLYINGTAPTNAIGYFPTSLFDGGPLTEAAATVDFGGETSGAGPLPPMGSGAFAAAGFGQAAFQRSIRFYNRDGEPRPASLKPRQDWPSSYSVDVQRTAAWGEHIFFGGPGGS